MVDYLKIVETMQEIKRLRWKVEMLDQYNKGPRYGALWINHEVVLLTKEDYADIVGIMRKKYRKRLADLEAMTLDQFASRCDVINE